MALPDMIADQLCVAARTGMGLVLLTGLTQKLRSPGAFREIVANYRLLPHALVPAAAGLILALEAMAGTLLLVGLVPRIAALLGISLFLVFALAMGINLRRGRTDIDCGCGGASHRQPISVGLVVRNMALAALTALALRGEVGVSGFALLNSLAAGVALFLFANVATALLAAASLQPRTSARAAWIR